MNQHNLLSGSLPVELAEDLRALNPHWEGGVGPVTPPMRRWLFSRLLHLLKKGLTPAVV